MRPFLYAIPTGLSVFRLLLAFLFPFSPQQLWIWMILAGGGSDFLDGWLARRWRIQSWQGGLVDGIADKLFVFSVLITFALAGKFSLWWIPWIIARDLTVTAIALYAVYCGSWDSFRKMKASLAGKLATAGQFLTFLVVLLLSPYTSHMLVITVLFSFLAAFDYLLQFIRSLKKSADKNTAMDFQD